jgi:hypothetical protein
MIPRRTYEAEIMFDRVAKKLGLDQAVARTRHATIAHAT